jgi:hypothetical protein
MITPRAHTLPPDPLIDEVRQRRQELLASCDNDLGKLAELLRRREADRPGRVMDPRAAIPPDEGARWR